jgi:hypothetical protein
MNEKYIKVKDTLNFILYIVMCLFIIGFAVLAYMKIEITPYLYVFLITMVSFGLVDHIVLWVLKRKIEKMEKDNAISE